MVLVESISSSDDAVIHHIYIIGMESIWQWYLNSNGFLFTEDKLFTNAEIKLVLPVPAYPFRRKIFLVLIDKMKSDN